jgi:hypothetical protein
LSALELALVVLVVSFLAVLIATRARPDDDDDDNAGDDVDGEGRDGDVVAGLLAAMNYGTPIAAEAAKRRVLGVGASAIEPLCAQLMRLDQAPAALTPRAQLHVEEVLADFGVVGWLHARDSIRRAGLRHPASAAFLRVLRAGGPSILEQALRDSPVVAARYARPVLWAAPLRWLDVFADDLPNYPAPQRLLLARALHAGLAAREMSTAIERLTHICEASPCGLPGVPGRHWSSLELSEREREWAAVLDGAAGEDADGGTFAVLLRGALEGRLGVGERERLIRAAESESDEAGAALEAWCVVAPTDALETWSRRLRDETSRVPVVWLIRARRRLGALATEALCEQLRSTARGEAALSEVVAADGEVAVLCAALEVVGRQPDSVGTERLAEPLLAALGAGLVARAEKLDGDALIGALVLAARAQLDGAGECIAAALLDGRVDVTTGASLLETLGAPAAIAAMAMLARSRSLAAEPELKRSVELVTRLAERVGR